MLNKKMKNEQKLIPKYSFKYEKLFFQLLIEKFGITKNVTLDIGCGAGFFTNLLNKMEFDVCGLDFDFSNIKQALETYGINFLVADSRKPPFSQKTFDLILSRGLSTFYTTDIADASSQRDELLNLLKINGVLIFITASNLSGRRTRIQNHQIENVEEFFKKPDYEAWTYFFFGKNHLFKLMRNAAFSPLFTKISRFLTKITKRSGYIVCIIKKKG